MVMEARSEYPAGPAPLDIDRVSVEYQRGDRKIRALDEITLGVGKGEVVGLVGPNGSGKTSLIRAVTNVVGWTGRISLMGRGAAGLRQREVARLVAVVPQEPLLPGTFTALGCVLMGRTPHLRLLESEGPPDIEAARQAMAATDTWQFADRRVGELSGGERQRVVVARALAQETAVLMLDEPTAHLDIGHQAAVLGLVRSIARMQGKAVLAVVHDLTLAAQYCDRLVALRAGRVVAQGSADEVINPGVLRGMYGIDVRILRHPDTGLPVVAPGIGRFV